MLDLTIVIPVKNEERNLPGCLEAIGSGLATSVVVLDSGSTDDTVRISEEWGAKVIDFKWDGKFPKKRNWYLRNHAPDTTWVLFLDADEYLTEDFKAELNDALDGTVNTGFWLNYSVHFLGEELKWGYPLSKLPLFRVGAGEYEKISESDWSKLDMEVHEHPVLSGKIGTIKAKITHHDYRGVRHYVDKHNDYSDWEAKRLLKSRSDSQASESWTLKQKLKYRLVRTPFIGPVYFFGAYFVMGGFLDGGRGLAFAILKMAYFTQVYCKLKELEISNKER